MVVTVHPEATAERLRPAVSLLGVHLTAGGRRWLLDLLPDDPGADAPGDRAAALSAALDDAAGDPARTVAAHGTAGIGALRSGAVPGDLVLTVGPPAATAAVGLRLRAWGVGHVTLPTGPSGPTSPVAPHPAAEAVLPPAHDLREAAETLAALGSALAATPARAGVAQTVDRGEVCITCADEAVVAEVTDVLGPSEAMVRTPDGTVLVDTTLVDALQVHDLVLVHARTAITQLDPDRR
jgi:hypothetical protein